MTFPAQFNLLSLDGTNGFTINGIDAVEGLGISVSNAGDLNGDGFDDIIIGTPDAAPNGRRSGQSYVVFGTSMAFISASLNLSNLDGTNGFALNGIDFGDGSGASVSSAGDINGDGFDDLIIGAPNADANGIRPGQSYVVFGSSSSITGFSSRLNLATLNGTNGFTINGINASDGSGSSVSSAGDVNGDGFDDLIIGASGAAPNGRRMSGQSYVVFGHSGGFNASFNLSTLDGTNGFTINGINTGDNSGLSVSSAGDINGDGFDDLIISASSSPNGILSGQSYVVFGKGGGFNPTFELSTLYGTNGFAINGINPNDNSGWSVSNAGDVNGDGFDDLIIGAPFANSNGESSGQSYVVFGKSGGFNASLNLSTLDGTNGFAINGINAGDFSGLSVSGAGDFNGDGFDDLIIGAPSAPNGNSSGQSYVMFGQSGGFSASRNLSTLNGTNGFALNGINAGDNSGQSVSSAGDLNGDGFDDILIGAINGESYVVFGQGTSTPLSTITVTVSPASVTEDDLTARLIYTFSRTGPIINPLAVYYTIGGTATNEADYETIGTSVTFVANSTTTEVIVKAINEADPVVEPDETLVLSLISNDTYKVGSPSSATGTIVDFDPAQYGASYPDLIRAFGYNLDALRQHYYDYGRFEGRSADNFDQYRYIASNPDLITFYGANGAGATEHYIRYGFNEGRSLTSFDPAQYLASNPNELVIFGYNLPLATLNYIYNGYSTGEPTDTFDETKYVDINKDLYVKECKGDRLRSQIIH